MMLVMLNAVAEHPLQFRNPPAPPFTIEDSTIAGCGAEAAIDVTFETDQLQFVHDPVVPGAT
jgi:hypothetical protein